MSNWHMTEDEMSELTTEELQALLPGLLKTHREHGCQMRWPERNAMALRARTDLKRRREQERSCNHVSENVYL